MAKKRGRPKKHLSPSSMTKDPPTVSVGATPEITVHVQLSSISSSDLRSVSAPQPRRRLDLVSSPITSGQPDDVASPVSAIPMQSIHINN